MMYIFHIFWQVLESRVNHFFAVCADSVIYGALKPQSPYMLFPNLVARVSNNLEPAQMTMLLRSYRDYQVMINIK